MSSEQPTDAASILLVDDRAENLLALQAILRNDGYSLVLARSGEEALNAALGQDFAVILLDVAMPELDGFATANLIKQRPRYRNVPIIFITASIYDIDNIYRGYAVGAVDYLYKPISPEIVRAKVAVFVEMFRQRAQLSRQTTLLQESAQREKELLTIRAEAALSASEAQYEATARQAPFGVALLRGDGSWLRSNQCVSDILGFTAHDMPPFFNLLHSDHQPITADVLSRLRSGELDTFRDELRLQHRDGSLIWVNATLSRLLDSGAEGRLALVLEDITERKWLDQTQRYLNQASEVLLSGLDYEASLTAVVELSVPVLADWCALQVMQPDGSLRQLALAHHAPGAAIKLQPLLRLFNGHARQSHCSPLLWVEPTAETVRGWSEDEGVLDKAAQQLPRSLVCVPMVARGVVLGNIILAINPPRRVYRSTDLPVLSDLANRCAFAMENARLYREAQQAVRARDDFLSVASHELRTPLTPLRLQLQRLIGSRTRAPANLPTERVRDILQRSERHVQRLGVLIDNLLDVSRITSGRLILEPEWVDLAELTREVSGRFTEELTNTGSVLDVDASRPVLGRWDRLRLEQVITNLLSNAIKYGASKPIRMSVQGDGDSARLEVQDDGIGIDEDKQARIFERFERAVSARSYGGLGLGLFIARQILDAHGGSIAVHSEIGQGTRFTVRLPCEPADRALEPSNLGATALQSL